MWPWRRKVADRSKPPEQLDDLSRLLLEFDRTPVEALGYSFAEDGNELTVTLQHIPTMPVVSLRRCELCVGNYRFVLTSFEHLVVADRVVSRVLGYSKRFALQEEAEMRRAGMEQIRKVLDELEKLNRCRSSRRKAGNSEQTALR